MSAKNSWRPRFQPSELPNFNVGSWGITIKIYAAGIWALPVRGGGLNPCPDGLGQLFWEEFAWFWGGLDPCPDGLGHFFPRWSAPECPFECGGVQSLKGQCPNAFGNFFGGASLNLQTKDINNLIILKRVNMSTVDKFSQYIGDEYPFMEMLWHLEIIYTHL